MMVMVMVMTMILDFDPWSWSFDTSEDVYDDNDEEVVLLIKMVFIAILKTIYFCQYYCSIDLFVQNYINLTTVVQPKCNT